MRRKLFFHIFTIRDDGCELVEFIIEAKVFGKRQCGRPKTSHSGNIAKWMGGYIETVTQDSWLIVIQIR